MAEIVEIEQIDSVSGDEVVMLLTDGRTITSTLAQVLTLDYRTLPPDEDDEP